MLGSMKIDLLRFHPPKNILPLVNPHCSTMLCPFSMSCNKMMKACQRKPNVCCISTEITLLPSSQFPFDYLVATLQWYFDLSPRWVQSVGHLRLREEAFILGGVPAFITPLIDEPFVSEHWPEMRHGRSVSLLSGSYVVCIRYVAAVEEMFVSLRNICAEGQGIFSRRFGSLLDFQAVFICAWYSI